MRNKKYSDIMLSIGEIFKFNIKENKMNKNIVILDGKSLGDISYEKLNKYGNYTYYDTTSYEEVSTRIKDAHIIFTNKVVLDKVNLAAAENLELICEVATGFNNIDIEYAKERGIAVTNVAGYSTSTVVQHTFATALALMDEVLYYDKFVKSGEYSKCGFFTCLDKPFNEIEGKTWGIIGLGNIGRRVAKIAEAFGAKVVYYSTSGKNSSKDFERVSFDELLKESDIITCHCPLTNETKGMINEETITKMKKSAIFINTSRGPVVDEKALANALNNGMIQGAGLDVLSVEPADKDNPLLNAKNCYITPHIAWAAKETRARLLGILEDNLKAYIDGHAQNVVNK